MIYKRNTSLAICRKDKRYAVMWDDSVDHEFIHKDFKVFEDTVPIGPTMLVEWTDE